MDEQLALITDAWFGLNDRNMLDCWVYLDYEEGGCSQGFGGIGLTNYDKESRETIGTAFGCDYFLQLLNTFGVDRIEKLKGKYCFAIREEGFNGLVRGLKSMRADGNKTFLVADLIKKHGLNLFQEQRLQWNNI